MLQKKKIVGTDLISLFGELYYKDHLYVGRELWLKTNIGSPEYNITHEEWNKIVITSYNIYKNRSYILFNCRTS